MKFEINITSTSRYGTWSNRSALCYYMVTSDNDS